MAVKRISPEEAKELLEGQGYIYLDVRTEEEFEAGHVPGAKNVPILQRGPMGMQPNEEFLAVVEANFGKEAKYITGCQKGGRSLKAAQLLEQAGFEVVDMRGGMGGEVDPMGQITYPGWGPRGLPVENECPPESVYETLRNPKGG